MAAHKPCENCPWRVGVTGKDIPGWERAKALRLAETCQRDGLSVMACHKTPVGGEVPCAGFVLQVGFDSIGLRMLYRIAPWERDAYSAEGLELHPDFDALLRASGIEPPERTK